MKKIKLTVFLLACIYFSGCVSGLKNQELVMSETYKAVYANKPVVIDGKLSDDVWQKAFSYPLYLSKDKVDAGQILHESGFVKFAWNDENFYLAADFCDSDIIAQGLEDEMHHYKYGDVCELFLKPANENYYWELYVTPAGKKSSFFYPSKGYLGLPNCLKEYSCGLKVATERNGVLNNWQDNDTGWTAEMAMPIKDLEAFGCEFGPNKKWKILVGRYNYSRCLESVELSMIPQLSISSFHKHKEYTDIEIIK